MRRLARSLAVLLMLAVEASPSASRQPTYSNPVINADFPDPTVIRVSNGQYYAYGTQTQRNGRWIDIQLASSPDLVHWRYLGDALPVKPVWASHTQDFWAPHVSREGSRYILYFSAKPDSSITDTKQGMCIGVATGSSPTGPFTDIGRPLLCGQSFVDIDPMEFDDPATGKHWLYWGSGFEPIKVEQLSSDFTSFAPDSAPKALVSPNGEKGPFPVLIEGSWMIRHGGWYYLFYSGDNCCGPKANYAVMIARSRSATGPFQTMEQATGKPNSIILQKRGLWIAPGHNSVVTDGTGTDWIVYHAVDSRKTREKDSDQPNTRRVMLIDRIAWRHGWPMIEGPSSQPEKSPYP